MPKEELLFLWKIPPALFGLGRDGRPIKLGVSVCNLIPISEEVNNEGGVDTGNELCG